MRTPSRPLALGGFMGVGKSTVGSLVAARAAVPFVDLDVLMERRHGPIADILADSEARFRTLESDLLREVLDGSGVFVLATGGGSWVAQSNRDLLRLRCVTAVLVAPLEVLAARAGHGERPLWDESVARRYQDRQAAYADCDIQVQVAGREPSKVAEEVHHWWSRSTST